MAVDVDPPPTLEPAEVLRCAAADVQRGDQVAFVSADQEGDVAGEVTGRRTSKDGSTIALVVSNRVHFVSSDHSVVVVRLPATTRQLSASASGQLTTALAGT